MNAVRVFPVSAAGAIVLRIIVRYGTQMFACNPTRINRMFAYLRSTVKSIIFISDHDCVISAEKPSQPANLMPSKFYKIDSPLIFKAYFNFDLDSEEAGLTLKQLTSSKPANSSEHHLRIDNLCQLDEGEEVTFELLTNQVLSFLNDYQAALLYVLNREGVIPPCLIAHYFVVSSKEEEKLVRIFYPEKEESKEIETQWRSEIHQELYLPRRPLLRRGMAVFPSSRFQRFLCPDGIQLVSPHNNIVPVSPTGYENQDLCQTIQGRYTYKHYLQDGEQDKNWGCAYRSLQTLASWLIWQGVVFPVQPLPTIRNIQEALVRVGDKQASFIGSKQWIGSLEVSFCIQELYDVQCRLVPIARGSEFTSTAAPILVEHFASGGGPVMVGGGQLAHTIIGVQIPQDLISPKPARYLILDPHYIGPPGDLKGMLSKGWVGWKDEGFWKKDVHYNLCLLPPIDSGEI